MPWPPRSTTGLRRRSCSISGAVTPSSRTSRLRRADRWWSRSPALSPIWYWPVWAGRIVVVVLVLIFVGWPLLNGQPPNTTDILFSLFIAGFLWLGASSSITNARMRLRLPDVSAGKLSDRAVGMPSSSSVAQLLAVRSGNPQLGLVLCSAEGRPEAVVDPSALSMVPAEAAAQTPASAVAHALAPGAYIPEDAAGQELVQYLAQLAGSEYAVIDLRGQVTGVLRQAVVVAAITGKPDPRFPR